MAVTALLSGEIRRADGIADGCTQMLEVNSQYRALEMRKVYMGKFSRERRCGES